MLAEIANTDGVLTLLAMLLAATAFGGLISRNPRRARPRKWNTRRAGRRLETGSPRDLHSEPWADQALSDATDQLRTVMSADFTTQLILNKGEARLFRELEKAVVARNSGWRVLAQVSLGEVLSSKDRKAYRCINSKRVDLLLMDGYCQPRHVIEYQGAGHHQGSAAARDAVKKEALRRAGVGYHEVVAGQTTPGELRRLVDRLVATPAERVGDQSEEAAPIRHALAFEQAI
jgi:hypothetical protein